MSGLADRRQPLPTTASASCRDIDPGGLSMLAGIRCRPQLSQHFRQRTAVNELHDIVVHTRIRARAENRNDVLVVEKPCRLRFHLESTTATRIERCRSWKNLDAHSPAERNLLGLVDHAHPAVPDLTNKTKLAELRRWREIRSGDPGCLAQREVARRILDELQTIEAFTQCDRDRLVTSQEVLAPGGRPSRLSLANSSTPR